VRGLGAARNGISVTRSRRDPRELSFGGSHPESRPLRRAPPATSPASGEDTRWPEGPEGTTNLALSSSAVATWAEFEASEPEFAARVRELMASRKHLTMASIRKDGSPRISGTEIEFADGQLRIGSMPNAVKALDLSRDPRLALHGPTNDPPEGNPRGWKGEAKIAGRAVEVESGSDAHRFLIDIHEVVVTHLNEAGDRLVVESWSPARGHRTFERE
jgi:hypothetical protein